MVGHFPDYDFGFLVRHPVRTCLGRFVGWTTNYNLFLQKKNRGPKRKEKGDAVRLFPPY